MEQNTNRMWWTIGIIVLGGLLISGFVMIANTNVMPQISEKANTLIKQTEPDVTHTAYSWSADGKDRFTTTKPNLNLLEKTNQGFTNWDWSLSDGDKSLEEVNIDGVRAVKLIKGTKTANTGWNYIRYNGLLRKLIKPNTQYVLSFDIKPSVDVGFLATLMRGDYEMPLTDFVGMNKALANQWTKVSCVLTSKETLPDDLDQIVYLTGMPTTNGNWLIIKNIKLEEGNTPTPYMPSASEVKSSDQPKYIGTYTDKSKTDSQDPSKYTWKLNPDYHEGN